MIKQLVQLVMPKQLSVIGAAFAIGSFIYGVAENKKRERDIAGAQEAQAQTDSAIRGEQAGRERRGQVRKANILRAQSEAVQFSQSGQAGDSGGVGSAISANLNRNFGAVNFALGSGAASSSARSNVLNAGRQSTFGIINQQAQPLIFGNIDKIDTAFESAFSSKSGTS